jgi:hypothetical protein
MLELVELPEDERDQRDDAEDGEEDDDVRAEPVVFLALVEDELKRAEAGGEQAEAEEVELEAALLADFSDLALAMCGGSSTRRLVRKSESIAMGTLMKKIQRQL